MSAASLLDALPASSLVLDVTADWFASLSPSGRKVGGGNATLALRTLNWEGWSLEAVANQYVVQLTGIAVSMAGSVWGVDDLLGLGDVQGRVIEGLGMEGMVLIESDEGYSSSLVRALKSTDLVASIEPNVVITAAATPNDSSYPQQWALNNTGQSGGTPDADIDAKEAWDITKGSRDVVIAVVDTGVDYHHTDLKANIWTNPGEIAGNGVDDDGNGFVDDVHGYDFVNNDGDPMDDNSHGTHVAGTIGAVGNNSKGVAGVAWNTSIMVLKFLDASGSGYLSDAVAALNYATMMKTDYGVNVCATNNSWGGGGYYSPLNSAINAGADADMLFVAAAGNNGSNNDAVASYPGNYSSNSIISVAATNRNDALTYFSNYGATQVDLAAPGVNIYNTLRNNSYGNYSGTSMAAPHVTGTAALIWSKYPTLSYRQVRDAIFDGVDSISSLSGKVATGGRLNAKKALQKVANTPDEPDVPSADPDAYEPNDSVSQVNKAAEGGASSPNIGLLSATRTISGLNTVDNAVDWFKFAMNGDGTSEHEVKITFTNSQGNLDLALYESDGITLVDDSSGSSNSEKIGLNGVDAGTYFVKVTARNDAQSPSYTLTIEPAMDLADDYENNDSITIVGNRPEGGEDSPNLAYVVGKLSINELNTLDDSDDFYRFRLARKAKGRNSVKIFFQHSQGDLDLAVYCEDGSLFRRGNGIKNSETVKLKRAPAGIYYAHVYGYNGAANPDYSLTINGPKPPRDKAGNSTARARRLKVAKRPRSVKEMVGITDDVDYWRMKLKKSADVTVELTGVEGDADLKLLDVNGQTIAQSVHGSGLDESIQSDLEAGTYYVVVSTDSIDITNYTLRTSQVIAPIGDSNGIRALVAAMTAPAGEDAVMERMGAVAALQARTVQIFDAAGQALDLGGSAGVLGVGAVSVL